MITYNIKYENVKVDFEFLSTPEKTTELYNLSNESINLDVEFEYNDTTTYITISKNNTVVALNYVVLRKDEIYNKHTAQKYAIKKCIRGNLNLSDYEKSILGHVFNHYIGYNYVTSQLNKSTSLFDVFNSYTYDSINISEYDDVYKLNLTEDDKSSRFYFIELKEDSIQAVLLTVRLDEINNQVYLKSSSFKTDDNIIVFEKTLTFQELYKFNFEAFIAKSFKIRLKYLLNKINKIL